MMIDDQRDPECLAPPLHEAPAMARRRFLAMAALGAVGATLGTAGDAAAAGSARTLAAPGLLTLLGSERTVQQIGESYRRLVPAEDDVTVLMHVLLRPSQRGLAPDLGAGLAEQIRDDFSHGRTVTVHGWILARTEARQCALFSLHAV